jgi:hypothetical protein
MTVLSNGPAVIQIGVAQLDEAPVGLVLELRLSEADNGAV